MKRTVANFPPKFQFNSCLHTAEYDHLFEGRKLFEYQTGTDLLKGPGT